MVNQHEDIDELKGEIKFLKTKMDRLFRALSPIASDGGSIDLLFYELDVSKEKEERLLDLMDSIRKKFENGKEYTFSMFENVLRKEFGWGYQTAKSIMLCLNYEHRYTEIYAKFKEQGMNI